MPGVTNAWTMPIKARIDMLTTGVRTPVGIKIYGADIKEIERIGTEIEAALPAVQGTRSVFAERTVGGYFVDFVWKRDELARYGLSIDDAQMVVMSAVGGDTVTTTVEGRERYSVNVRYFRDYRSDVDRLRRVLVPTMGGKMQVPLAQLADVRVVSGPAMLRNENGMLNGYVYVDVAGRDVGSYVEEAKRVVAAQVKLPPGYALEWSGQYEAMQRVTERLKIVVPVTLLLVVILLYVNTRSVGKTAIILLAVPFSAVGAIWLLYLLDYNMSIGVWVGLIALLGRGRRDRRVHAPVPGSVVRGGATRRTSDVPEGPAGGGHARRRQAHPAEVHDGRRHVHGPAAHHVVDRAPAPTS